MAVITLCEHCKTPGKGSARYCKDCNTAEKRREMDDYNNKLWLEKFGKPYVCPACSKDEQRKQREASYGGATETIVPVNEGAEQAGES